VTTTLTEADRGKTIEVRVGDTVALCLHENAATGYRWTFDGPETSLVDVQAGEHGRQPAAVGSGGEVSWMLRAAAPGTAQVKLKLWRPWEGAKSIQKRFSVTVRIG